jgi:hypothetical protein
MSLFQRLSAGNGTNPFRLALCPRLILLQLGGVFPPPLEVSCKSTTALLMSGIPFCTCAIDVSRLTQKRPPRTITTSPLMEHLLFRSVVGDDDLPIESLHAAGSFD